MLQDINTQLFLMINASNHASNTLIYFAIFSAKYLAFLPVIMMGISWFFKPQSRLIIRKIVISLLLALVITFVIRHFIYSPRPFVLGIGTNYLAHDQTSSFPSQHAVFMWTICLTLYFNCASQLKRALCFMTIIALLVSWSRVYLGIHWPLDIVAGFLVSLFSVYVVYRFWFVIQKIIRMFFLRGRSRPVS